MSAGVGPPVAQLFVGTPACLECWPVMARFCFQFSDIEGHVPEAEDWLEFATIEEACVAAEIALREMAFREGPRGPSVSSISIVEEGGSVVHRVELEVRSTPCQ